MEALRQRFIAYLEGNKDRAIPEYHLIKVAKDAGYSDSDIEVCLSILKMHEFILREDWKGEHPTFQWVEKQVKYNRNAYANS